MRNHFFTVVLLLLVAGCACATSDAPPPADRRGAPAAAQEEGVLRFSGRVVHVPIEGGFFGIIADDGRKYDPRNLPAELQRDGLAVQVAARPLEGVVGFHMWGRIVEIVEITKK